MKKNIILTIQGLLLCLIFILACGTNAAASMQKVDKKTSYLIKTEKANVVSKLRKRYKTVSNKDYKEFQTGSKTYVKVLLDEDDIDNLDKRDMAIENDSNVEAAKICYSHNNTFNIKNIQNEWSISMIKAAKKSFTDKKVKIAIIDSGLNYEDTINIAESKNFIEDEICDNPLFLDASGHGLAVTGVLCDYLNAVGLTENVELYSARVLDDEGKAPISRVINSIYWAIDHDVDVINMSFGMIGYSELLEEAIEDACQKGIILVAAAGNNSVVEYPAAFEEVISVGSVGPSADISEFCSNSNDVDIYAPGEYIEVKRLFGETEICSGTSLSTPLVVGVIAGLYAENNNINRNVIIDALKLSSIPIDDDTGKSGILDSSDVGDVYTEIAQYKLDVPYSVEERTRERERQEDVDVNRTVVSSWKQHGNMVKTVITGAYQAVIDGARYLDEYCSLSYRPELHGGGINTGVYNATNYIACYSLMIKCANTMYTYENNNNGKKMTLNQLRNEVNDKVYSTTLKQYNNVYGGNSYDIITEEAHDAWYISKENGYSKTYCRRLLYGIGMHILADSYAHSTYRYYNNSWIHLVHSYKDTIWEDELYADNSSVCYYRYDIAKAAIVNTWDAGLQREM